MLKTSPRQVMWLKWNAQHPSRVLYMPFLNCNSHTHVVTIYKLALGKVRISSHLEIWNSSNFSHSQPQQPVQVLMVRVHLWPEVKLSALFPFPLVAVWCALKPKLSLGGGGSNPGSVWPIPVAVCDMSLCRHTQRQGAEQAGKAAQQTGTAAPALAKAARDSMRGDHTSREAHKPFFLRASPKPMAWGQCPLFPSLLGAGGNREWLRTAQSRALITALTVMSVGPFPRLSQVHPWERDLSVDTAGRCFQPHHLGDAKTQTKLFDWSLPPSQPRSGTVVPCCLCRMLKYPSEFIQGCLGTKPDHIKWCKLHQLTGTIIKQKTSPKFNLHQSPPHRLARPIDGDKLSPGSVECVLHSLHLPLDLVAWKGTSLATTDLWPSTHGPSSQKVVFHFVKCHLTRRPCSFIILIYFHHTRSSPAW